MFDLLKKGLDQEQSDVKRRGFKTAEYVGMRYPLEESL